MRFLPIVLGIAVAALAVAGVALSKEDARAHLSSKLPLDAGPGTKIRVRWTVDVPDEKGNRVPFGAGQMFVRLLSRTGAAPATAFTNTDTGGANTATVVVPGGGIGGLRIGLRGTTDIFFPLMNDPFLSAGGVRCDVAVLRGMLRAFVRAYNRGDMRRLQALFSHAANRKVLLSQFRGRHRHGERLSLTGYRLRSAAGSDLGRFQLTVGRRADDLDGTGAKLRGTGSLDCTKAPITIAALKLRNA